MSNADKFLSLHNEIEKHLEEELKLDRHETYYRMLDRIKHKNAIVKRYELQLKKYADLRNVIVHETIGNKSIAEPNDEAVEELEMIKNKLYEPKKVFEIISNKVITLNKDNLITEALQIMKKADYSQVPIYDNNNYTGMINSEMITKWVINYMEEGSLTIKNTKIKEILVYDDETLVTEFVSSKASVFDVYNILESHLEKNHLIQAIIVTENGK